MASLKAERATWHYKAVKLGKAQRKAFIQWFKDQLLGRYKLTALHTPEYRFTGASRIGTAAQMKQVNIFRGFEVQIENDDDYMLFLLRWSDCFL